MSDDRSDRLKRRRQQTDEKVREATGDKAVKPDKTKDGVEDEKPPVKKRDNWNALQVQLPDELRDELEIALDETNLELKKAGEEKLEKLAHWYPLVVKAGVETIQQMDVDEIRDEIKQFE